MAGKDTEFFSNRANCYGYAAKCADPLNGEGGGQARPGGATPQSNAAAYLAALQQGVLADAGTRARQIGQFSVAALSSDQIPVPAAGWYLVAMLTHDTGFHFVRRQLSRFAGDPFWKWKQGNPGMVERNAFEPDAKRYVRVTNANFPKLIRGGMVTEAPGYTGWQTVTFFEVHPAGFTVSAG
ncbi:MAG: hypothetical protein KDG52_15170 [Rhodocyclaceae bacterium]|nr:hypothetical protein [Rhodocyclaceae bacterium]